MRTILPKRPTFMRFCWLLASVFLLTAGDSFSATVWSGAISISTRGAADSTHSGAIRMSTLDSSWAQRAAGTVSSLDAATVSVVLQADVRGQMVRPNAPTNVVAVGLGDAAWDILFDYPTTGACYVVFTVDRTTTSSDVYPAGRADADANAWRVEVPANRGPALNLQTRVRPLKQGVPQAEVAWGVDRWRGARYEWSLHRTDGNERLAGGSFSLAAIQALAGTNRPGRPVALLHGIGGRREKWSSAADFVGQLGSERPVYAVEYPNIGDIAESARLVGRALEFVDGAHGGGGVHLVAHSMGGVVAQYYRQKLGGAAGGRLLRLVTLGSPLEGSGWAETATADGWKEALLMATLQAGFRSTDLMGILNSRAMFQLTHPRRELGLAANDSAAAKTDDWLPGCGTRGGLFMAKGVLDSLLSMANPEMGGMDLIRKGLSWQALQSATGSDGVVSWHSSLKRPIEEPQNLYYDVNHQNYFQAGLLNNADYAAMVGDINGYLAHGMDAVSGRLRARPPYRHEVALLTGVAGGTALHDAIVYAGGEVVQILGVFRDGVAMLLSPPGAQGTAAAVREAAARSSGGADILWVHAPGYVPMAIGHVASDGAVLLEQRHVALEPDPDWLAPRNPSIRIEGGAPSTSRTTVTVEVQADNAAEMAIYEMGGSEPVWVAYAGGTVTAQHAFASGEAGVKTIVAAFRNGHGEAQRASAEIALMQAHRTGSLSVQDGAGGGAAIVLNGYSAGKTTPHVFALLEPGLYSVALHKEGVSWRTPVQTVEVRAGEMATVSFQTAGASAPTAPPPVFRPEPGGYTCQCVVVARSDAAGAIVRYTLDGSAPGPSSPAMPPHGLVLRTSATVRATAFVGGAAAGDSARADYSIVPDPDDWDCDGVSNEDEIRAGTDPHDPDCFFAVKEFRYHAAAAGGDSATMVLRWRSVPGRVYNVDRSTNLVQGFVPWATNLPATPPVNVVTDALNSVKGMYRVTTAP
jgi:hypothetical protein